MSTDSLRRALIEVEGGRVYFNADPDVVVEIIDWDSIEDGTISMPWTTEQVNHLRDTFRGLLGSSTVDRLMLHAEEAHAKD